MFEFAGASTSKSQGRIPRDYEYLPCQGFCLFSQ